jgi:phage portal protein BeeE
MRADEAQFLESRSYQVEEIARQFRMPPLMIGHADKTATYASAEQFFLAFVVHTLTPVLTRWEQALKRSLFTENEADLFPEFLVAGLLRGDIKSRYAAYAIARQWGWLNADEIREFENMNPLPDGKGEIYLEPLNMIEAGTQRDALAADSPASGKLLMIEFARQMTRALGPAQEEGMDHAA